MALVAWVTADAASGVRLDEENLVWLAVAVAPAVVSWVLLGQAWASLTGADRGAFPVGTWSRTQALRYLPGGFWGPAARATTVQGAAVAKASTVVAEAVMTIAVGAGVGGVALGLDGDPRWALLVLVPILAPLAVVVAGPGRAPPLGRVVVSGTWYLLSWALFAFVSVACQLAVGPVTHPVALAGAACVARMAGMGALIAPGGVGVREIVYVALVSGMVSNDRAAAGAIAGRLVLTVAELAVLVALGLPWLRRRRSHPRLSELTGSPGTMAPCDGDQVHAAGSIQDRRPAR